MMEVEATPLHTPWPKEFPELRDLDELLKCKICYEYMQTTLIAACSHSFCSMCIRKYLQYENQCPLCFTQLFDNQLRNNRTLDEVIEMYLNVKNKLSHHLRISSVIIPPTSSTTNKDNIESSQSVSSKQDNSKKLQVRVDVSHLEEPSTSKSKKRQTNTNPERVLTTPKRNISKISNDPDIIEVIESNVSESPRPTSTTKSNFSSPGVALTSPSVSKIRVPNMFTTSPKSFGSTSSHVPQNTVPCPVCSVDIPVSNINLHLDKCLQRASGDQPPAQPKIENKMKRLPKLVYTLLSDKDLKKKAKEYGLNILGDRKALISRLKRYTVIYNSECDKARPRSLIEILQQVEKEEKLEQKANTQVEKPTALFSNITRKTDQKVINEVNEKYIKENEDTFKMLIQKMKDREGQNIRPTGIVNRIFDDEEVSDSEIKPTDAESGSNPTPKRKTSDRASNYPSNKSCAPSLEIQPNPTKTESIPTPRRSTLDRLSNGLFNKSRLPSPESPILSKKRSPDHREAALGRSSLFQEPADSSSVDHPIDEMNGKLDQSNESFSILDNSSQLDFPMDIEPNFEKFEVEHASSSAAADVVEDENSASSVELFVSQNRQRKRKVAESNSAADNASSSSSSNRRLRKRVDR